tara:strand:- start:2763 stop:3200 length:438 start_codon:yes stop_codon:yes gene_type:complete
MYKNFIIEKKTNREIKGVFLQDLWFTHELNLSDKKCCNDIHFMLLISKYDKDKIELDLNRFESGHPYTNEKPSKTCVKYYNFVLKKNEITEYYNLLHNDKSSNNIKNITLTDVKYKNTTLLLDICNVENKMYLMLPKFTIIKQQH